MIAHTFNDWGQVPFYATSGPPLDPTCEDENRRPKSQFDIDKRY